MTFDGTTKHLLYKKDQAQWNPGNENHATNYQTPVPNRAWVRAPALSDPVCYTKGATGGQQTTTIELSISPPLTAPLPVTIKGKSGGSTFFQTSASLNGSSAAVGPMSLLGTWPNQVLYGQWSIDWYVNFGQQDISIGSSSNIIFLTWGTPAVGAGEKATAKRMLWATSTCTGSESVRQIGTTLALGLNGKTRFGTDNPANRWEALDGVKTHDCYAGSVLATWVMILLGVGSDNVGAQVSYPSIDVTKDPDYPSDVTTAEPPPPGKTELWYYDGVWNRFEGNFKAKDGTTWLYWTWIPILTAQGAPFSGTGEDDTEKNKSALYKVLDGVRRKYGARFYQKWDKVGPKVPLP